MTACSAFRSGWRIEAPVFDRIRAPFLRLAPGRIADSLAVYGRGDKQQLQLPLLTLHTQDHAAHHSAVCHDAQGRPCLNGLEDRVPGDDLPFLLKMGVPDSELLQSPVAEGLLVVPDKLLPVFILQRYQFNFHT